MVIEAKRKKKLFPLLLLLNIMVVIGWATLAQANTINGVGKLEFGMKPSEVLALEGCSSQIECLYDLLGKNRYFTLRYNAKDSTNNLAHSPSSTASLTHIDIDMGNHTKEWFGELYEVLVAQYPVSYIPTAEEDLQFQKGTDNELIIGFAEGSVLLKIVRRPFGNMILRVIYQDSAAAKAQRQSWEQHQTPPSSQ